MQSIFKRREYKYLITREQGSALQQLISQYMSIDQHGEYLVQNLYYDTADWDIIRKSIEKPLYKEKLRLRFYDHYTPKSQGFLELKKKFDGVVYKRRIAFPLGEFKSRSVGEIASANDSQISREIDFYLRQNQVSEKIYIAYKRITYTGIADKNFRITFDRDIFFRLNPLNTFDNYDPGIDHPILDQDRIVMEIKITGAMSLWLAQTFSENNIFPLSFSKFGVCYTKHISKWQNIGGIKNAA